MSQSRVFWARPVVLTVWTLAVAAMTIFLAFELLPLPKGIQPLKNMSFSQGDPPLAEGPVSLPDNWRSHSQRPIEGAIYSARFDHPDAEKRWAVYIPSYSGRIEVTVNGLELTPGGFISGELSSDQSAPYLAPISPNVLQRSDNSIRIALYPGGILTGFLSQVFVGPAEALRDSYDWYYLRAVQIPILVVLWQLLLAALLFLLWYNRRSENAALYCAIVLLLSSVHGIPVLSPSSVALADAVGLLGYVTNLWLSVIGVLFVHALVDRPLPLKARYFLVPPAVATLAYLTLPQEIFRYVDSFAVVPFSLVMSGWAVYLLVHATFWEKRWDTRLIMISVLGACGLVIHDTLIIANVTPNSNFLHFRIVYLLILPALSVVFFQRLIESMNHVDNLVSTLEERIEQKEHQLRETYDQRQLLEGRQALSEERQRIMRDVHDGLGGQLMSIIAMSTSSDAKPDQIEASARAALEDLRTMIHSLGAEEDITGLLGTFRERAEQQLALQGVELDWNMIEIPPIEGMTPSAALNVMRILQEAVTNAAKHAGGDRVAIRFSLQEEPQEMLTIEIEDNGRGLTAAGAPGHGLKNMKQRAQAIDGRLEIGSSQGGTRVSLSIPTKFAPQARLSPA